MTNHKKLKELLAYLKDEDNYQWDFDLKYKTICLPEVRLLLCYMKSLEQKSENLQEKYHVVNNQKHAAIKYIKDNITYYYDDDLDDVVYQDEVSGDTLLNILGDDDNEIMD